MSRFISFLKTLFKKDQRHKIVIRQTNGAEVVVFGDTEHKAKTLAGMVSFKDYKDLPDKDKVISTPVQKQMCMKRSYNSKKLARLANKNARFRVRPYFCNACHRWHVANPDKV